MNFVSFNVIKIILIVIFLGYSYNIEIKLNNQVNNCPIQLSQHSHFNFLKDPIINDGIVVNKWNEYSIQPYRAKRDDNIDYFYLAAYKDKIENSDVIGLSIRSYDTTVLDAEVLLSDDKSLISEHNVLHKVIEVKYNCKSENKSYVKLILTIKPSFCQSPIDISWSKLCSKSDNLPSINIGLSERTFEILNNGVFQEQGKKMSNLSSAVILPKDINQLTFYFTSINEIDLITPKLIANQDLVQVLALGHLKEGGKINNSPSSYSIVIECNPLKTTDFQTDLEIAFEFKNYDPISLFVKKTCEGYNNSIGIFSFFESVFYLLMFLLFISIIGLSIYYIKKNNLTFLEYIEHISRYIRQVYNSMFPGNHYSNLTTSEFNLDILRKNQNSADLDIEIKDDKDKLKEKVEINDIEEKIINLKNPPRKNIYADIKY